jgi:hypothetical protein
MRASHVAEKLRQLAAGLAGPREHARVIVDAATDAARGAPTRGFDVRTGSVMVQPERGPTDAGLMGRAARVGAIMAKDGVKYPFSPGKYERGQHSFPCPPPS